MTMTPGEVERKVRQLDNDVLSIYEMLASISAQQSRHLNRLNALDAKIDTRCDALEARLDGHDARFDTLETRFDGLETRFDGLETRFDTFETRLDGLDTKLDRVLERLA